MGIYLVATLAVLATSANLSSAVPSASQNLTAVPTPIAKVNQTAVPTPIAKVNQTAVIQPTEICIIPNYKMIPGCPANWETSGIQKYPYIQDGTTYFDCSSARQPTNKHVWNLSKCPKDNVFNQETHKCEIDWQKYTWEKFQCPSAVKGRRQLFAHDYWNTLYHECSRNAKTRLIRHKIRACPQDWKFNAKRLKCVPKNYDECMCDM